MRGQDQLQILQHERLLPIEKAAFAPWGSQAATGEQGMCFIILKGDIHNLSLFVMQVVEIKWGSSSTKVLMMCVCVLQKEGQV